METIREAISIRRGEDEFAVDDEARVVVLTNDGKFAKLMRNFADVRHRLAQESFN
jgi:hypothetical protein